MRSPFLYRFKEMKSERNSQLKKQDAAGETYTAGFFEPSDELAAVAKKLDLADLWKMEPRQRALVFTMLDTTGNNRVGFNEYFVLIKYLHMFTHFMAANTSNLQGRVNKQKIRDGIETLSTAYTFTIEITEQDKRNFIEMVDGEYDIGNGSANFKQFLLYQQLNSNIKKYKLYSRTDNKELIK